MKISQIKDFSKTVVDFGRKMLMNDYFLIVGAIYLTFAIIIVIKQQREQRRAERLLQETHIIAAELVELKSVNNSNGAA